ncbi:phytanoyl-CoA dioxygenase family protein [Bythopirellula goksoeyrii]|uniref:1-deoxypentalenic acid 11-beta-hydroxylase n=1 Tax=Bythopirellula goksoeyrii TaxID=1400387 RepID=A0A5B9Q365_9BACT|nr:phytanoyl-CoA dioxygenase family protein [Bythopirellula goksoeyrii]QEG33407.1 1-deoxypentalenic acid 11-beta-hydroxylase [Bythopirellula goksoeyrii]
MADWDTEAQEYATNGVIRLREFFDINHINELRSQLNRYVDEVLANQAQPHCTYEADGKTIRNLWRLDLYDGYFRQLANDDRLLSLVGHLVKGEPELVAVETFNKPARVGSGVPYHQDNAYFCQSPPDVLTVWIAIDPVTVENGAVYYIQGSQHQGMLPTKPSGTAGNSIGLSEEPEIPKSTQFCCTLEPGDMAIHHCQTIHHSDPNTSDKSRLGLLMVFKGSHTKKDHRLSKVYASAQTN